MMTLHDFHEDDLKGFRMRLDDAIECQMLIDQPSLKTLTESIAASNICFTMKWDGRPVAFLGVTPVDDHWTCPWLLASEEATKHPKGFHKCAKEALEIAKKDGRHFVNFVQESNRVSKLWLTRLGFTLDKEAVKYGWAQAKFLRFTMYNYNQPEEAAKVFALEQYTKQLPQVDCPLKHYFADGVYVREIFMPSGSLITGRIHKHEHVAMLTKGEITIHDYTGTKRIKAPFTFVSQPGIKRALITHEDSIFVVIYRQRGDITNVDTIDKHYVCETQEEFVAYQNLLTHEEHKWLGSQQV